MLSMTAFNQLMQKWCCVNGCFFTIQKSLEITILGPGNSHCHRQIT